MASLFPPPAGLEVIDEVLHPPGELQPRVALVDSRIQSIRFACLIQRIDELPCIRRMNIVVGGSDVKAKRSF